MATEKPFAEVMGSSNIGTSAGDKDAPVMEALPEVKPVRLVVTVNCALAPGPTPETRITPVEEITAVMPVGTLARHMKLVL